MYIDSGIVVEADDEPEAVEQARLDFIEQLQRGNMTIVVDEELE